MRRPVDTSIEARERQLQAYRAMTPEDRLGVADRMSAEIRSLARSGIRARHPDLASDVDVEAALARILLGPEAAAAVIARRLSAREGRASATFGQAIDR
jgi:hypothetical protein